METDGSGFEMDRIKRCCGLVRFSLDRFGFF